MVAKNGFGYNEATRFSRRVRKLSTKLVGYAGKSWLQNGLATGLDGKVIAAGRSMCLNDNWLHSRQGVACVRVADKCGVPIATVVTSVRQWLFLLGNR
jgi:hypothetical protein